MWCKKKHCLYSTVDINKAFGLALLTYIYLYVYCVCMCVFVISYMLCSERTKRTKESHIGWTGQLFPVFSMNWRFYLNQQRNQAKQCIETISPEISTCLRLSSVITDNQMRNRNINI